MTGNEKKDEEKKGIWSSVAFRKNFLTGLFIILPIALSVSVFVFVINFILGLFRVDQIIKLISKLIERMGFEKIDAAWLKVYLILALIVFIISIIYLIGLFARYIFMRKIISLMDKILYKIPIFNKIYMTVKQIAVAFKSARATIFKNVVLIEYPRKGLYTLGFLTMKARGQIQEITREAVCNVFIPTTPNPTSGFLIMVPEKDIVFLDMSVEDAMKLIISGGAVTPEKSSLKIPKKEDKQAESEET